MKPKRLPGVEFAAEMARQWSHFNDPAAKLARRKERASRGLMIWLVLTILCGIAAATGSFPFITGVVIFGALGVRAGMRLVQLNRVELPPKQERPRLPSRSSATYEPMKRLAQGKASLDELLGQLSAHAADRPSVPEGSVSEARATASDAERALSGLARRIQAIERAREAAPAGERASLDAAVSTLCEQLEDGLESYGSLLAAAGRAVAATGSGLESSQHALTDATDHLAGMAIALRELS